MWVPVIDNGKCVGAAQCVVFADSLFTQDEAGYGLVKKDAVVGNEELIEAQDAVLSCPSGALKLIQC